MRRTRTAGALVTAAVVLLAVVQQATALRVAFANYNPDTPLFDGGISMVAFAARYLHFSSHIGALLTEVRPQHSLIPWMAYVRTFALQPLTERGVATTWSARSLRLSC